MFEQGTPDIRIRPATMADVPRLCDLLAELFTIEADFVPAREKQRHGLELLVEHSASGLSIVLVAVQEQEVVGMCSVQTVISTAEGRQAGIIEDLVVHRDLRGQGIGGWLVSAALDWCTAKGMTRVQLLTDKDNNPALHFYFSRGWARTGLICLRKHL